MGSPFSLAGKVALVTGASRGLGAAIAVGLAEAGAVDSGTIAPRARTAQAVRTAREVVTRMAGSFGWGNGARPS